MANIRDVARLAGVSVTTVSRVLNDHPYVQEEKRQAVLAAIEESGYVKNLNAVSLSRGKTEMVGIVLPFTDHSYFAALLKGIAEEARIYSKKLVLFQTDYESDQEIKALEMLKHKQIDACIFCSRSSEWTVIEPYQSYGQIVMCEEMHENVSYTFIDQYQVFMKALHYLERKAFKRIGYCIGRRSGTNSEERERAYRDFLSSRKIPYNEAWIFDDCYHMQDGERVLEEIGRMSNKPDALLVTNDQTAAGILLTAEKAGLNIPEDLGIMGFENHPIAEMLSITTIDLPLEEMGRSLLRQAIKHEVEKKEVTVSLIERHTI
ncbi:LacI family transcriptional regulator [Jeotgalibacillus malaysiensis]|uniref:LacI family transcriptional regulator n=1 Tax=Jeotgalibacillus malaysiensis TaxID=1508404 RepID=A0A0B5AKD6_9BACL|nr:LacI family DNA-binding transcriptional regulator [Jeotgalibacillus malaysiensis]AJD90476.1 LacI family transcriptional regulator [Jeotgalibacillus malaysiensis]